MKKNDVLIVNINDMDSNGNGLANIDDTILKVKGAITGQKMKVRIKKIKKNMAEASLMEVYEKSTFETSDVCKDFGECGGCTYLNVEYKKQLEIKENIVKRLLSNAGILNYEFLGIEGSPEIYAYRNKMEYTFGLDDDRNINLGLHKRGKFYDIVTTKDCRIVDADFIKCIDIVLKYVKERNLPIYNIRTHEGFLRHFVVRKGGKSGEILLNIVTTSQITHDFLDLADILKSTSFSGKLVGLLHTYNDGLSDVVKCDKYEILYGRDYFMEDILGLKFKISAFSFFQTNSYGAEKLYSIARDFAGDIKEKTVFDLYCGTGTIGIIMAPYAKNVIGIELVKEAVDMAKENAEINGLDNCKFLSGDVSEKLKEIDETPDLVILDPPRPGVNPKAIMDIIRLNPGTIVYVSCNPESLARDLKMLTGRQYKVVKVKCVDMFPHTYHVETVALLASVTGTGV